VAIYGALSHVLISDPSRRCWGSRGAISKKEAAGLNLAEVTLLIERKARCSIARSMPSVELPNSARLLMHLVRERTCLLEGRMS